MDGQANPRDFLPSRLWPRVSREDFERAVEVDPSMVTRVIISQASPSWIIDDGLCALGDALECWISKVVILSRKARVKRLLLYDLPSDLGGDESEHRRLVGIHRARMKAISRFRQIVNTWPETQLGQDERYAVRALVLPRVGETENWPAQDLIVVSDSDDDRRLVVGESQASKQFESMWEGEWGVINDPWGEDRPRLDHPARAQLGAYDV